jgi:hypothetical protein
MVLWFISSLASMPLVHKKLDNKGEISFTYKWRWTILTHCPLFAISFSFESTTAKRDAVLDNCKLKRPKIIILIIGPGFFDFETPFVNLIS